MKTKKIVSKRFKISAGGTVMRRKQNARHLRSHKSKKQLRRLSQITTVSKKMAKTIKKFMPNK